MPLGRMVYKADKALDLGAEFTVVIGAALREKETELNFLYSPRAKSKKLIWIIVVSAILLIIFGTLGAMLLGLGGF